jgi:hypothetical protein
MSTSSIYHAFGLQGYDYVRQDFVAGCIHRDVRHKARQVRCSICKSRHVLECDRYAHPVYGPIW